MRIGIDARFLTHPQTGGFKTYTENLVQALHEVDNENQYKVYLDRQLDEPKFTAKENITYQAVTGKLPGLKTLVREQLSLRRQLNRDTPDVIHFLCNTAPIMCNHKYILTLHDTIQVTAENSLKLTKNLSRLKAWGIMAYSKWDIKNVARSAQAIITVSNFEKTEIVKHLNIDPAKICVTYLAPNPIFAPAGSDVKRLWRAELGLKFSLPQSFVLGIGYEPRKNIPLLIDAFTLIAPHYPDLGLVLVTAEPGRRLVFQQMAAEKGLNGRVIILASMPPVELNKLYNLADVFVFPSERESFGLPPLEAMACGTPVIASDCSSIPEITGKAALFAEGKDASMLANTICLLLSNKALRANLVSKGLERAAKFSWERCAQQTIDVYEQVYLQIHSLGSALDQKSLKQSKA
jgi:glycosyltransferase involved in cell wall biosynthesis